MWELDSKKAEHWIIDAFGLWCWRKLLRVPWTARRSNQSILKEISPEYSLEGLMLKLKLKYFGYLMQRTDSFEKNLVLGKIEGGRRKGWQRMDGITNSTDMSLVNLRSCWWTGRPGMLQSLGSQRVGHDLVTEQQQPRFNSWAGNQDLLEDRSLLSLWDQFHFLLQELKLLYSLVFILCQTIWFILDSLLSQVFGTLV